MVDVAADRELRRNTPPLLSCTIITTDAAGPLAEIHDRMPLTISERDWDRWLDPDAPVDEGLLRGHGDLDRIEIREVSRLVNSVRNNGPQAHRTRGTGTRAGDAALAGGLRRPPRHQKTVRSTSWPASTAPPVVRVSGLTRKCWVTAWMSRSWRWRGLPS